MAQPERFGKYPITGVLGKGAMGVVYKAVDPVIKRPVAIKTIRKELIEDDTKAESIAARFRHEARAAGALQHPAIVSVYEYGEDNDFAYIAMEYVEGASLREYFARKVPFEEKDIVSLMAQLLEALAHAHERGVWHRDIKPANLIVTNAGRLKVADFGIARIEASELTQAGTLMGTPGYIAPEIYLGHAVDHRCDVFSAGAVLYQLLTGEPPFTGAAEAVMYKVCHEDPLPPSEKDPRQRWQRYDPLISIALAKAPQNRFHTAAAFREAVLSAFAKPVSETISEETIIAALVPVPVRGGSGGTTVALGSAMPGRTAPDAANSGAPTNPSNPPSSLALPTGWDATLIAQLEKELASHIGVVARAMVRKFARQTNDVNRLIELLAAELDPKDRQAFLAAAPARAMASMASTAGSRMGTAAAATRTPTHPIHATRAVTGPTAAPSSLGTSALQALTPEHVEKAATLLGAQVGPIAKVLAKRAAAQARDRAAFHAQLAAQIEDIDERTRFLQALAKL